MPKTHQTHTRTLTYGLLLVADFTPFCVNRKYVLINLVADGDSRAEWSNWEGEREGGGEVGTDARLSEWRA